MDNILLRARRGGVTEGERRGHAAVVDGEGRLVASIGNPDHVAFLRSAAKPFQALPFVEAGGMEAFGLEDRHLAVMIASHNAERIHIDTVREILDRVEISEEDLRGGVHPPFHERSRYEVICRGGSFGPIHNNCSGKHAGMLALAKLKGWPLDSYLDPDHPVQRAVKEAIEEVTGVRFGPAETGVDGCGIPTFALPVRAVARGFARVATGDLPEPRRSAAARIVSAAVARPDLIAGTDRVDTDVMREGGGRVFSKQGAMGIIGVGLLDRRLGFALKMEDGYFEDMGPVVRHALGLLGALSEPDGGITALPMRNWAGREVGRLECDFRFAASPEADWPGRYN
ncbi:MAG: asparaginase [Candidatus Eisenbacteria bacterium]